MPNDDATHGMNDDFVTELLATVARLQAAGVANERVMSRLRRLAPGREGQLAGLREDVFDAMYYMYEDVFVEDLNATGIDQLTREVADEIGQDEIGDEVTDDDVAALVREWLEKVIAS